ncbi:MAG: YajQ family cyclic di-GMP-binding protein [Herpetosiphon sp.]
MPAESTFDVVSEFDRQELINAIDQAVREIRTRFDLKDSKSEIIVTDKDVTVTSDSEMHLQATRDLLQTRALRRNLSLKIFEWGAVEEIGGMRVRQIATLREGISDDVARKIQKLIKENAPKVQARIQGDTIRVGSKSKDDLQQVIQLLRERAEEFPVPIQFTNYR